MLFIKYCYITMINNKSVFYSTIIFFFLNMTIMFEIPYNSLLRTSRRILEIYELFIVYDILTKPLTI